MDKVLQILATTCNWILCCISITWCNVSIYLTMLRLVMLNCKIKFDEHGYN